MISGSGKIPWGRNRLPIPVFLGFHGASDGKESSCSVGDLDLIPGLGRSPGEGKDYPLQYSGLENSIDHIVHGVMKSWTQLINSLTCPHPQLGSAEDRVQSRAGLPAACTLSWTLQGETRPASTMVGQWFSNW